MVKKIGKFFLGIWKIFLSIITFLDPSQTCASNSIQLHGLKTYKQSSRSKIHVFLLTYYILKNLSFSQNFALRLRSITLMEIELLALWQFTLCEISAFNFL